MGVASSDPVQTHPFAMVVGQAQTDTSETLPANCEALLKEHFERGNSPPAHGRWLGRKTCINWMSKNRRWAVAAQKRDKTEGA